MICIFDCETVPDVDLVRSHFKIEGSDKDVSLKAFELQKLKTETTFLPIPFHKIISICAVIADDYGVYEKVSCIDGKNEKDLIENFLNFINKKNPKLVSFNGRSFDMPLLLIRAMKYSLSVPAYFETDNQTLNKTKWDNYRYRFSDRFHVDLMDHISEFGAVRGLSLGLLSSVVGIPGKFDISGNKVFDIYYKDEIDKIREYCQSDVLNTYWLYLKYELLKGNLLKSDYLNILLKFKEKISHDKSYSDIFITAIEKELEINDSDS
ncbi:MAG TPA: 3'-5' exonuclease [Campylobacterales bacterium]|nr:3'-5' exonuclease [Campylobacterales bacterium]